MKRPTLQMTSAIIAAKVNILDILAFVDLHKWITGAWSTDTWKLERFLVRLLLR